MPRRVVVTGMGCLSAIGLDEETTWANLMAGRTGIRRITAFDPQPFKAVNGAEVDGSALEAALVRGGWKSEEKLTALALVAADQTLRSAGLIQGGKPFSPQPLPVLVGSASGPAESLHEAITAHAQKGIRGIRPSTVPRCMVNIVATRLSIDFHLTGVHYNVSAACTSAEIAMGLAFRMVRDGYAERILCGGAESLFVPSYYSAWNNLGILSTEPDASRAIRPFAADHRGFVMGEGAAFLVLEEETAARRRGARIRGEICGYGEASDAEHIVRPQAEGQAQAIRNALADAGMAPADIGWIVSHGTGTVLNDRTESAAIRSIWGAPGPATPPVSALKSYVGHTIGASGAVEMAMALLALERGRLPPNLNAEPTDPECGIRLVGRQPEPLLNPVVVKQSFGFGGANGVMVARRYEA